MATESLIIKVDERGARVVSRNIEEIGRSGKTAAGGVGLLKRSLAGLGVGLVAREVLRMNDSFINIQNRLRLVTNGTAELNEVQDRLLAISQRTRSDLGSNVELFNRLALASRELGTSQEEVLQFTESLNQAIKISGATAAESSAGLIQLSQGLASGALRGDELRSVLEQLPAVADVIAKELGVTRGQLRQMGFEGKITSEIILRAFKNAREELNERFSKTVGTTGEELIKLKNATTILVGEFFQASGVSSGLASALNSLTQWVERITPMVVSFGRALVGTLTPQNEMTAGTKLLASAVVVLTFAFSNLVDVLMNTVGAAFKATGKTIGGFFAAVTEGVKGNFSEAATIFGEIGSDVGGIAKKSFKELSDDLIGNTTDTIDKLVQIWDKGARLTAEAQKMMFEAPTEEGNPLKPPGGGADKELEKLLKRQKDMLAQLQQEGEALKIASETGREFGEVLQELQLQALGAQGGLEGFTDAALAQLRANRELNKAIQERNARLEEARQITEAMRTPMEVFQDEVRHLHGLFLDGSISAETFGRAVRSAFKNMQDSKELTQAEQNLQDFFKRARENMQDILGNSLAEAFTGGLEDLPRVFANTLLQLASQFLASEIFRLLGSLGQSNSGGILKSIGNFFAGSFATGGQFVVPGSGGTDSQLVTARMTPGEIVTVQTPAQAQAPAVAPAPVINVPAPMVVVVDDPSKVPAAIQSSDGKRAVLDLARNNARAFREAIGVNA